jgi:hypothetical protein
MAESTITTRPALDVQPRRSYLTSALVLSLLAVPGTTLAWDLPLGGLWIGLPLAVAAIWLGVRALPGETRARRGLAIAAIVLAALCLVQMLAYWVLA